MRREEALDILQNKRTYLVNWTYSAETCGKALNVAINALRSGKWVEKVNGHRFEYVCSVCGAREPYPYNLYCANCGAKMVESHESEDKE